jgi:hypothetical protein
MTACTRQGYVEPNIPHVVVIFLLVTTDISNSKQHFLPVKKKTFLGEPKA